MREKNSKFDYIWETKLNLVKEWQRKNPDLAIGRYLIYKGVDIGDWLHIQKNILKNGKLQKDGSLIYHGYVLSVKRQKLLAEVNLNDIHNQNFYNNFTILEDYVKKNHELPDTNTEIGKWLSSKQKIYNKGCIREDGCYIYRNQILKPDYVLKLNSLNKYLKEETWNQNSLSVIWKKNYNLLAEFKKIYGRFPKTGEKYKGVDLASWCQVLRVIYKKGKLQKDCSIVYETNTAKRILTKEQIDKLDDINFIWYVQENVFLKTEITSNNSYQIKREVLKRFKRLLEIEKDISKLDESFISSLTLKK